MAAQAAKFFNIVHAVYAAMQREERDKGTASRFRKVDRGLFAYNAEGK
jgi:hypothetical protein